MDIYIYIKRKDAKYTISYTVKTKLVMYFIAHQMQQQHHFEMFMFIVKLKCRICPDCVCFIPDFPR